MASPPYRSPATSPPNPAHSSLPNPRKRPLSLSTNAPPHPKKHKPSSFSTTTSSAHPLRQTSFPPEEAISGERSPSVESDITAATGARSARGVGGRRRRKGKKKDGAESIKSADRSSKLRGAASRTSGLEEEEVVEDEEDDDEGDGGGGGVEDMDGGVKVDEAAEKKKLAVLTEAFNEEQTERYEMYRRVKLKKETVRRIVNQTLSQSVPQSVITAINVFTKVFIGTLVERAREVEEQYAEAEASLPYPPDGLGVATDLQLDSLSQGDLRPGSSGSLDLLALPGSEAAQEQQEDSVYKYLGPLQPDHLREAFRRYRRDGESGGVGVGGGSVGLGLSGAGVAKLGGRRLFR